MAVASHRFLAPFLALGIALSACSSKEAGDNAEGPTDPATTTTAAAVDEGTADLEPTTTLGQAEEVGGDGIDLGAPVEQDAWTTAVDDVDDEGVRSLESALALFTIVYGDLPGASAPTGELAPTTEVEGTIAIHAILGHWNALSPEQRDAVRAALELPTDWVPGAAQPSSPIGGATGSGGATGRVAVVGRTPSVAAQADERIRAFQELADRILPVMEEHVGMLGFTPVIAAGPSGTRNPPQADTITIGTDCRIRMFSRAPAPEAALNVMAHELFHCFEMQWSPDSWPTLPDWRIEGMAEWAGVTIAHEMGATWDSTAQGFIGDYFLSQNRPLFARSYDATVWFHHVEDRGVDLFDLAPQVFTTTGNADVYTLLTAHAAADYARTWATGDLHRFSWGADWYHGFTDVVPAPRDLPFESTSLADGDTVTLTSARAGTARRAADVSAEITTFSFSDVAVGTARISGNDRDIADVLGQDWCTGAASSCVCPPDTADAGRTFPRLDGGQHLWAFTGELTPASVTVRGRTLRDVCGPEDHCLVGEWVMNDNWVIPGYLTVSGGSGLRFVVTTDGQATFDYNDLTEYVVEHPTTSSIVHIDMWGAGNGRIDLDATDGTGAVSITDLDWSGLTGAGTIYENGELVFEFGEEFVSGIIDALSYDTLFAVSACSGTQLSLSQTSGGTTVTLPFVRVG